MKSSLNEPLVWIVIPSKNRSTDLIECIKTIKKQTYKNFKIIVVDNNSDDDTLEKLKSYFPTIEVLKLARNYGASFASNRGFEFALKHGAEYVLRLDSDTLLDKEYLSILIKHIQELPNAGIVSGSIFNFFQPDSLWFTGGLLTKWNLNMQFLPQENKGNLYEKVYYEVDLLPSTGMLISKEVIELIDGFDEDYLVYFEDFDFCINTKKTGRKIYYIPKANMWHKIYSNKKSAWTAINWNKSKMIYYRKHAINKFHFGFLVMYAFSYSFFRACFPKENRGNRGPLLYALRGLQQGLITKIDPHHHKEGILR